MFNKNKFKYCREAFCDVHSAVENLARFLDEVHGVGTCHLSRVCGLKADLMDISGRLLRTLNVMEDCAYMEHLSELSEYSRSPSSYMECPDGAPFSV